jgi:hypothetical protein
VSKIKYNYFFVCRRVLITSGQVKTRSFLSRNMCDTVDTCVIRPLAGPRCAVLPGPRLCFAPRVWVWRFCFGLALQVVIRQRRDHRSPKREQPPGASSTSSQARAWVSANMCDSWVASSLQLRGDARGNSHQCAHVQAC